MSVSRLAAVWPALGRIPADIGDQVRTDSLYAGYLQRQDADIRAFRRDEALLLPDDLDYGSVPGLSREVQQKLAASRPASLAQASRISGVTPAALTVLLGHVRRSGAGVPQLAQG